MYPELSSATDQNEYESLRGALEGQPAGVREEWFKGHREGCTAAWCTVYSRTARTNTCSTARDGQHRNHRWKPGGEQGKYRAQMGIRAYTTRQTHRRNPAARRKTSPTQRRVGIPRRIERHTDAHVGDPCHDGGAKQHGGAQNGASRSYTKKRVPLSFYESVHDATTEGTVSGERERQQLEARAMDKTLLAPE